MTIKISVKTLDSQNYDFEAQDGWTVSRFKEHIQDTVNVVASEQRLIFCGRVLQNERKLTEYDCDGRVIHLVRRPPVVASTGNSDPVAHQQSSAPIGTTSTMVRSQAGAAIVLASDPGQSGIFIPLTLPVQMNTQLTMEFPRRLNIPPRIMEHQHPHHQRISPQARPPTDRSSQPSQSQAGQQGRSLTSERQYYEALRGHSDWIPVIEADITKMERQSRCPSGFSDAYLSSVPKKRRRLLVATPDKVSILQPSPSIAITNLLRRAMMNTASTSVESLDRVLTGISSDANIQAAYEDHLKSAVKARLSSDLDYDPNRFKSTSRYFA